MLIGTVKFNTSMLFSLIFADYVIHYSMIPVLSIFLILLVHLH